MLNIHSDVMSVMGCGGCVVDHNNFVREDQGLNQPAAVSKLGQYFHPILPVTFRRDTKSCWFLLPGVYARGSIRSDTKK